MTAPLPFVTSDMSFAAFLLHKKCDISVVHRAGRRVSWEFLLAPGALEAFEAEWPSSDASAFFHVYQTLKGQLRKRN